MFDLHAVTTQQEARSLVPLPVNRDAAFPTDSHATERPTRSLVDAVAEERFHRRPQSRPRRSFLPEPLWLSVNANRDVTHVGCPC